MKTKPTKLKPLTLKQKKFVEVTAKTLNATEGARQAYNLGGKGGTSNETTVRTIASENLTKPNIAEAIETLLKEDKTSVEMIHKRNMAQNNSIPASNQAVEMYYKLNGSYAPERSVNLNINLDNVDEHIKDLTNELNNIQEEA